MPSLPDTDLLTQDNLPNGQLGGGASVFCTSRSMTPRNNHNEKMSPLGWETKGTLTSENELGVTDDIGGKC